MELIVIAIQTCSRLRRLLVNIFVTYTPTRPKKRRKTRELILILILSV